MKYKRVELLAPAGNIEGFYGAIHAGADAVYLGGNRFGARAYADNFTTEELLQCIRYAHLWNRRVYLTVNTLVKDSEIVDVYDYIKPFYEAGLDGVIVQDIGVFAYIREHFPEMELHVSTQMTLTGVYGAKLLRDMGACRIVPARELNLEEIRHIKEQTGLAIETFVHGAMCYCYSGQCLFSSVLGGRSGNRGRCAQPCRLPYLVKMKNFSSEQCYPLSLKDMCTIENIPELIEAGIDSFKIEGRMKKPEYTAGVTAIYRKYIDQYYEQGKNNFAVAPEDLQKLSNLYIRSERHDGYYHKNNGKDMVTLSSPAYSGSDEVLLSQIRKDYLKEKPKLAINIYANFQKGQNSSVTLQIDDLSVTVEGNPVETASKQPINEKNIQKQLGKLGDSIFKEDTMVVTMDEDAFYPLGAVNELRRNAVEKLEEILILQNGFSICRDTAKPPVKSESQQEKTSCKSRISELSVFVHKLEQLNAVQQSLEHENVDRVYLDCLLLLGNKRDEILELCHKLPLKCRLILSLPRIIRERDYAMLEQNIFPLLLEEEAHSLFTGVHVCSLEAVGMLVEKAYKGQIYTDSSFYVWNRETLKVWENLSPLMTLSKVCLPLELKGTEQKNLADAVGYSESIPFEKVVFGRAAMMVTANCVVNTTHGCMKNSGEDIVYLEDRYRKKIPVDINCIQCTNTIYNSVPLMLKDNLVAWNGKMDLRLDFSLEKEYEARKMIEYYAYRLRTNDPNTRFTALNNEYTTGHERRGVE